MGGRSPDRSPTLRRSAAGFNYEVWFNNAYHTLLLQKNQGVVPYIQISNTQIPIPTNMKKKITSLFIVAILSLVVAVPALAQYGLKDTAKQAQYQESDIYTTLSTVISLILVTMGIVFLTIIIYAGLRWMTARGNEEFINKAKDAMFGAIMGLILVSISYALSAFIFSRLIK